VYVCHCEVVSDHSIRSAVTAGARDIDAVATLCGAGGACGGCHPAIEDLIADAIAAIREPELLRARQARRRHRRGSPVPAVGVHAVAS
jgi:bacterioferritin-associated ferredoxin